MATNIEIVNAAVTLIIKAAILAARFSGRARKRSLKRLSKMNADDKDKEIIFLRDKVYQQQIQITILQKGDFVILFSEWAPFFLKIQPLKLTNSLNLCMMQITF